jgi:hypothetical protein
MLSNRIASKLLLSLIITMGFLLALNPSAKAQKATIQPPPKQDVVSYLKQRLQQQNVPLSQIKVLQDSPLELEITLQSLSIGDRSLPEDFMNEHLTVREVVLANRQGYKIHGLTRIVQNINGEIIDWFWTKIENGIRYTELGPARIANSQANDIARQKVNAHGMSISELNISSLDGLQVLTLHLSAKSLEEANRELPPFIDSLRPLATDMNARGTQIAMINVEVKGERGEILLNYVMDLQFRTVGWWTVGGMNTDAWRLSSPLGSP